MKTGNVEQSKQEEWKALTNLIDTVHLRELQALITGFYTDIFKIEAKANRLAAETSSVMQQLTAIRSKQNEVSLLVSQILQGTLDCAALMGDSNRAKMDLAGYMSTIQAKTTSITADCKKLTALRDEQALLPAIPSIEGLIKQMQDLQKDTQAVLNNIDKIKTPAIYEKSAPVAACYQDIRSRYTRRFNETFDQVQRIKRNLDTLEAPAMLGGLAENAAKINSSVDDCKLKVKTLFSTVKSLNEKVSTQQAGLFNKSGHQPQQPAVPAKPKEAKK